MLGVESGCALEVEIGGGLVALGGDLGNEALAVGVEEGFDGGGFGGVGGRALGGDGLVAGGQALVHLLVDAAGVGGVRGEVFVATAELEEVEDGVAVAVGGGAGGEGAVEMADGALRETVGGVDAGEGVFGCEAEEEGRGEFEAAACFGVAEERGGGVVEGEGGLELGAGDGVVDGRNFVAEVETLGLGVGWGEEAAGATTKVGGAGEVGLGGCVVAAEGEDAGFGGDRAEDGFGFDRVLGREGNGVLEVEVRGHRDILSSLRSSSSHLFGCKRWHGVCFHLF